MNQDEKEIEDVGEFGFIRSIMKDCVISSGDVVQAIGDDCAVIGPYGGKVLLITTDLLIEGVHFMGGKLPFRELGAKAVAVNLSDIAAMGGVPRHLFVSLAIPRGTSLKTLQEMDAGMKEMSKRYEVNLLGGDTSASPGGFFINVAAIGEADAAEVLYRRGACPGDRIYVTGTLGDAGAGLRLLKGELTAPDNLREALIAAHNRPEPRLEQGRLIAGSMLASAMIDISDGLISDLGHICEESGVGARIFEESLPLSDELRALCRINELEPGEFALSGGEDYELLFTMPEKHADELQIRFRETGLMVPTAIGVITEERALRRVLSNGSEAGVVERGFEHFTTSSTGRSVRSY